MATRYWNALVAAAWNALNNVFYAPIMALLDLLFRWGLGSAPALWADLLRSTNLAGTYANGSSGVGATLTVTATGALTVDSETATLGKLVLLTAQTSPAENGLYYVSTAGATGVHPVLTRWGGWDTAAEMIQGSIFYIRSGTVYYGQIWAFTGASSPVVGTDSLTFIRDSLRRTAISGTTGGGSWDPVQAASTVNVTLATPGATMDGYSLVSGDRVLLKNQGTASQNGIYVWTGAAALLTRATDANNSAQFSDGKSVEVLEGNTQHETFWLFDPTSLPFTLGTDDAPFARQTDMMLLSTGQTVTAIKRFADLMLAIYNGAGTFLHRFRSLATADRQIDYPDDDGTADIYAARSALTGAGVIPVDAAARTHLATASAAGDVQTLADGVTGQRKTVILAAVGVPGTDTVVVTPAHGGPWTLDTATDYIRIEFDGTNWILLEDGRAAVSVVKRFTAGLQCFVNLIIYNAAGTFAHTITSLATAARALAIPDAAGTFDVFAARSALTGAGAIDVSVAARLHLATVAAAGVVQTLADGVTGQHKRIQALLVTTPGTDTLVVTPAHGGPWTLYNTGDWIDLHFDGTNWILEADGRASSLGQSGPIEAFTGAGTADAIHRTTLVTSSGVGDAVALTAGAYIGQWKTIQFTPGAPGQSIIVDGAYTIDTDGDSIVLEWTGAVWGLVIDSRMPTIPLATKVSGNLPVANGGTNTGRGATGHFRFSARPAANDTQQLVINNGTTIVYEADGVGANVNWVRGASLSDDMIAFRAALVANSIDCTFSDPIDLGGAAEFLITVRVSSAARVAAGDGITTIAVPVNVGGGGTTQDNGDEVAAQNTRTYCYRHVVTAEDAAADYFVIDTPLTAITDFSTVLQTTATDETVVAFTATKTVTGGQLRIVDSGNQFAANQILIAQITGY